MSLGGLADVGGFEDNPIAKFRNRAHAASFKTPNKERLRKTIKRVYAALPFAQTLNRAVSRGEAAKGEPPRL